MDGVQETRKQDILKYIWFDFHHETKGMKYHHLSKLVLQIDEEFRKQVRWVYCLIDFDRLIGKRYVC